MGGVEQAELYANCVLFPAFPCRVFTFWVWNGWQIQGGMELACSSVACMGLPNESQRARFPGRATILAQPPVAIGFGRQVALWTQANSISCPKLSKSIHSCLDDGATCGTASASDGFVFTDTCAWEPYSTQERS